MHKLGTYTQTCEISPSQTIFYIWLKKIPQQTNTATPSHLADSKMPFSYRRSEIIFLKLHEASQALKDPQCDIKLCARQKWIIQTAKKPKVTNKSIPRSKNLYLYKGKLLSLQREGGIKTGSGLLLDLEKQSCFLELSLPEKIWIYIFIFI